MLRRVRLLKGLNLRDSVINRNPEFARDLRNVEKDSRGQIVLRWGYEEVGNNSGIIDLFEYVGSPNDPNRGALIALKSDGLHRLEGDSLVALSQGNVTGQPTWTDQTKPVEYNKVLYWNDPSFNIDLWKFDGFSTYRAGVPRPSPENITYSGTAGQFFFRVIFSYADPQGNITWSDYFQVEGTSENIRFDIDTVSQTFFNQYYQKFARVNVSQYINSGSRTINVESHNYVAGDWAKLQIGDAGNLENFTEPLQVESVTPTSITFTAESIGTIDAGVTVTSTSSSLEDRWQMRVFRSTLEFSNYEELSYLSSTTALVPISSQKTSIAGSSESKITIISSTNEETPLESVYDDTLIRVLPPKGSYLALYNEQMFIGNLGSKQPDFGFAALLGNDTRLEDSIAWSDIPTLSNGSSVETFLINNIRSVGNSQDGVIKGIHGNDDSFVVHKEKQSFYVNGDFISNSLRVRRAMAEQNGAASHRSIKEVEGGHIFSTPKGIFLALGGSKPIELSDVIEPLFTENALSLPSFDLSKAKSVNDFLREKIYIFVPYTESENGFCLVYDYYYKDWYLHDNIRGNRGFQDVGVSSTEIYFADSTSLYRRNLSVKKDLGKKLIGYYWSGWFDLDEPNIVKQFQNIVFISIKKAWNATIKAYCDWNDSEPVGEDELEFGEGRVSMDSQLFQNEAKSVSYRISNESDGSDFLLTCYDVEAEITQTKPKGDV